MRRLILGTAGHIDHGKTALIRALTGTDTDRLPEEKRRGITIDLGFARLALASDAEVGIVDVPGHEAFVRNMLAGATGIDMALLVIAADEGVMPQTREHAAIIELLGVQALIVALTKTDLVEPEWIELVTDDVRTLLQSGAFHDTAIVPVSARTGTGLGTLIEEISRAAAAVRERSGTDLFRLPVDRIFTVRGTGTVVTGTVWSGSLTRDDTLRLLPADQPIRIRALQSHGEVRDAIRAGERAAIAVAATGREAIQRGDVLVVGDGWEPANRLTLRLRVLESVEPGLKHGQRVRFHLATSEVIGRLISTGTPIIASGDEDWIQIRLERPIVARAGDPFVLRSYSPVTTIGGGRVAEPGAPRRKRLSEPERDALSAILAGPVPDAIEARTVLAGWAGETPARMAVTIPAPPDTLRASLHATDDQVAKDGRLYHRERLEQARRILLESVDRHHSMEPLSPGIRLEHLRQALPASVPQALIQSIISSLEQDGTLAVERNRARRPDYTPRLAQTQESAATAILDEFSRAGLASPLPEELPAEVAARPDLEDLLHHLVRTGRLVALGARRFLSPVALEDATRLAAETFRDRDGLTPGEFRDLFGISRKYLIPLLEHFDRTGVTIRDGEGRRMAPRPQPGDDLEGATL